MPTEPTTEPALPPDVAAWRAFSDRFMDPAYREQHDSTHIRDAFAAGWDAAFAAGRAAALGVDSDAIERVLTSCDRQTSRRWRKWPVESIASVIAEELGRG